MHWIQSPDASLLNFSLGKTRFRHTFVNDIEGPLRMALVSPFQTTRRTSHVFESRGFMRLATEPTMAPHHPPVRLTQGQRQLIESVRRLPTYPPRIGSQTRYEPRE